jgi:allophanate hydrolase subunit 1
MAVTTAALAVVSFVQPEQTTPVAETAPAYSAYSVIMDQDADEQMSYEQVLSTIYEDEDETR